MAAPYASTSLYVGDLAGDVNEGTLFELFSAVGPVMSIRVCRDAVTNRSLGYAYVNFTSNTDATRALESLNGTMLHGRPCRVMWSQRDPSLRRSGVGNIFVKNLHPSIDQKVLHDTFVQFGSILSCKVAVDENNQSRGYGFVHFDTQIAADTAIERVNGMLLANMKVFVGPFVARKERSGGDANASETFTNVYVKNLPENFTKEQLFELFGPCGKIISAVVMTKPDGQSRLFGFVNFETHEAAQKAVDDFNTSKIGDKELFVGRAQKKHERAAELAKKYEQMRQERLAKYQAQQATNVYIRNLDTAVTEEQLRAEFTPAGTITSVKIVKDDKGASRGYGFVSYTTAEEAQRAVTDYNNKTIGGKSIAVAIAQRKDARVNGQIAGSGSGGRMRAPPAMPMYPYYYSAGGQPIAAQPMPVQAPAGAYGYPKIVQQQRWNQQQQQPGPFNGSQPQQQQQQQQRGGGGIYQQQQQQQQQRGGGGGGRGYTRGFNNRRGGGGGGGGGRGGFQQRQPFQQRDQGQQQNSQLDSQPIQQDPHLAAQAAADQKMVIGEQLYPLIEQQQPALAGKITGMILESCLINDLINFLSNPGALANKVHEALVVLQEYESKEQQQQQQQQQQQVAQPVDA